MSLYQSKEGRDVLRKAWHDYMRWNDSGEVADAMLWDAGKAYMRGIMIQLGSRWKKEREKQRQQLMQELGRLQAEHSGGGVEGGAPAVGGN